VSTEIERKFLVVDDAWRAAAAPVRYCQGYLDSAKLATVRVRVAGNAGYLTVKGPTIGVSRSEYEYEIPVDDARAMLEALCRKPIIDKRRSSVEFAGMTWEVDEYHGANDGLIVAEVELEREDQSLELPPWVGEEITGDCRYRNSNLAAHPYREW
jgi:CYTH domain-containing protein|tara:strand:+ start:267 stop:731 length:465 start_codon:yes stop_codon:yes gene_type:complete